MHDFLLGLAIGLFKMALTVALTFAPFFLAVAATLARRGYLMREIGDGQLPYIEKSSAAFGGVTLLAWYGAIFLIDAYAPGAGRWLSPF